MRTLAQRLRPLPTLALPAPVLLGGNRLASSSSSALSGSPTSSGYVIQQGFTAGSAASIQQISVQVVTNVVAGTVFSLRTQGASSLPAGSTVTLAAPAGAGLLVVTLPSAYALAAGQAYEVYVDKGAGLAYYGGAQVSGIVSALAGVSYFAGNSFDPGTANTAFGLYG